MNTTLPSKNQQNNYTTHACCARGKHVRFHGQENIPLIFKSGQRFEQSKGEMKPTRLALRRYMLSSFLWTFFLYIYIYIKQTNASVMQMIHKPASIQWSFEILCTFSFFYSMLELHWIEPNFRIIMDWFQSNLVYD